MRHRHALLFGFFLLIFGNTTLLAQQFSADLLHLKPEGAAPAKVFVRGDRVRFETVNVRPRAVTIIDIKLQTGFMVLPEDKTYTALRREQILPAIPFFHASNPENACVEWEALVQKQASCRKAGDETINGRQTVKYKGVARNGDTGWAWVDSRLHFVIKWEGQAGAAELRNIEEGPQTASLFEIPQGFEQIGLPTNSRETAAKRKPQIPGSTPQKPQK